VDLSREASDDEIANGSSSGSSNDSSSGSSNGFSDSGKQTDQKEQTRRKEVRNEGGKKANGTMQFYRNDVLLEGARIDSLPLDEPLHLVASPVYPGRSVSLAATET
jgi:hypothetical protein